MSEEDALKKAEKLGYAKGYAAGKRKRVKDASSARHEAQRQAFRQRAFLAALPSCILAQGWQTGDTKKPINSLPARVNLAWDFADEALKRRY